MHRSEELELTNCIECGAELSVERDRGYPVTDDDALCYECALRRGGKYDEVHDRWAEPPNVTGLEGSDIPEERPRP